MSEALLMGVILALLAFLGWEKRQERVERNKLVNALLARNASELRDLEFVEKVKIPEVQRVEDPLVSTADMSDEEFDKHIEEQLKEQA